MKKYPDVSELFELAEKRRRALDALPVEEKMAIAARLREIGLKAPMIFERLAEGDLTDAAATEADNGAANQ
jgi:hypothetical protein